jgi:hypothetical protein
VELSFRGVGAVGAVLGEPVAGGVPVQVVVLQVDQAGTGGFGGGEGAGLQGGKLRRPAAVGGCGDAGGPAVSPPMISTSSGTRAWPQRWTSRSVSPRLRSASKVARPIARSRR